MFNTDLLANAFYHIEIAAIFILMISTLVAIHELGHYLAARSVNTDVEEFAIGFGKKIKTLFYYKGTEFTLRLWPLGGFVRMKAEGLNNYDNKPPLAKIWIRFAGPLFSLLLGVAIIFCALLFKNPTCFWNCLSEACLVPLAIGKNFWNLVIHPWDARESAGSLGSIVVATAEATNKGFTKIFELSALLSISIGYMNLLPIPPLDSGQMLIPLIELLRRGRRLSMRTQTAIFGTGFVLLMGMMVSMAWLDIHRFITGNWSNVKPQSSNSSY